MSKVQRARRREYCSRRDATVYSSAIKPSCCRDQQTHNSTNPTQCNIIRIRPFPHVRVAGSKVSIPCIQQETRLSIKCVHLHVHASTVAGPMPALVNSATNQTSLMEERSVVLAIAVDIRRLQQNETCYRMKSHQDLASKPESSELRCMGDLPRWYT